MIVLVVKGFVGRHEGGAVGGLIAYLESHPHQGFCWRFGSQVEGSDSIEELDVSLARACCVGLRGLLHILDRCLDIGGGHRLQ